MTFMGDVGVLLGSFFPCLIDCGVVPKIGLWY